MSYSLCRSCHIVAWPKPEAVERPPRLRWPRTERRALVAASWERRAQPHSCPGRLPRLGPSAQGRKSFQRSQGGLSPAAVAYKTMKASAEASASVWGWPSAESYRVTAKTHAEMASLHSRQELVSLFVTSLSHLTLFGAFRRDWVQLCRSFHWRTVTKFRDPPDVSPGFSKWSSSSPMISAN